LCIYFLFGAAFSFCNFKRLKIPLPAEFLTFEKKETRFSLLLEAPFSVNAFLKGLCNRFL